MQIDIFDETMNSLPIILLFWVISGYIFLNPYYGYFNINVINYFSLEDYLRASVSNITSLLFIMGISWFATYWSEEEDRKLLSKVSEDKNVIDMINRKQKQGRIIIIIMLTMCIISAIINTFIHKSPVRYTIYYLIIFLLWLLFFKEIFIKSIDYSIYDKISSLKIFILFFFIPYSISYLYFNAKYEAANIVEGKQNIKVKIITTKDYDKYDGIENNKLILIGISSEYSFFYNDSVKQIYIIRSKYIAKFETSYNQ